MKKIFLLFFFSLLFLFLFNKNIPAIECEVGINLSGRSQEELQEIKNKCEEKVSQLAKQRNTLASEISYIDTQIYLTNLKVAETENKIEQTEKEIGLLNERIEGLDESLNTLSKLLLKKIVADYKNKRISLLSIFLEADRIDDLVNRIKYIKTTRENNQRLIIQVQNAKINFEEQKKLREEKKAELDNLKLLLAKQKTDLLNQQNAKRKLLTDTQNSEVVYQQILTQAQRQLAAFKSFVQQSGAATVISANAFGTGSDGNYYSQRDERWAYQTIGYSSENILNVGCLITSTAMVGKKMGLNLTPSDIASNYDNFYGLTAYLNLNAPILGGKSRKAISIGEIDSYLNSNQYVIAGVYRTSCNYGGDHFVVLTKKEGDTYKMHDPIYGPDKNFSDYYSSICSAYVY
jgi:peptidoglycan hydrolase CwlO-like protein